MDNNKSYSDVALIVLKDLQEGPKSLICPDEYTKRYVCCQVVSEKEHQNTEENLKFFNELEKKAKELKVIKLNIMCHGTKSTLPGTNKHMLGEHNLTYINSIKTYLRELRKFMLKHKHIKLYINNDICYGARIYLKKSKDSYTFGDLFEDYKKELNGVLDRVVVAAVKGEEAFLMHPGIPNGLDEISHGIRRFDAGTSEGFMQLSLFDKNLQKLSVMVSLLAAKYLKENQVENITQEKIDKLVLTAICCLLAKHLQRASRAKNFRKYYHFDDKGNLIKFDKNSTKAKAMKNEFLGIKTQKAQKLRKPLSLADACNMIFCRMHRYGV